MRQQALDQRQRQLDERQQLEAQRKAEADRRALADKVYVWTELRSHTFDSNMCVVRFSNVSDAPAFLVTATLHLTDGSAVSFPLGSIPPRENLGQVDTGYTEPINGKQPGGVYVAGVSCEFRDANGLIWRRDAGARLTEAA